MRVRGPLAIAEAAAGWDQSCWPPTAAASEPGDRAASRRRRGRCTGSREGLDADELEAALAAALADAALDPRRPRPRRSGSRSGGRRTSGTKPPAGGALRGAGGRLVPAAPAAPVAGSRGRHGDPGHVPARHAVAVDGKERKGAKAGGNKKVHLLAAVTHTPGMVIGQDKVAKSGKANEISHFRPLLAPLPLKGPDHQRRDAGEPGQRPVPSQGEERALPVARPGQPAGPEPDAQRAALGGHPGRRRHQRDHPGPDRDPDPARPALPRGHWTSPARSRPCSSSGTSPYKKKGRWHMRDRGRPLPHKPRRRRGHPPGPASPRPRPLAR